jgi:rubrerythrin
MPTKDQTSQNNAVTDESNDFDPTQDIDLSSVEYKDTARGDVIDDNVVFTKVYRVKCKTCQFVYEGKDLIKVCPKCGSVNLDDSETTQTV